MAWASSRMQLLESYGSLRFLACPGQPNICRGMWNLPRLTSQGGLFACPEGSGRILRHRRFLAWALSLDPALPGGASYGAGTFTL